MVDTTPLTPLPPVVPQGQSTSIGVSSAKRHGHFLLFAIMGTIVAVAVQQLWLTPETGTATLLVRATDGTRSVQALSLETGIRTPRPEVSTEGMHSRALRTFTLSDGSVISVEPAGIVRTQRSDTERVTLLVASAVPTTALTPLSVWGDGEKIAWVSPADNSIQVFEKNERGVYLPVFVRAGIPVSSLQFSAYGDALIVAKIGLSDTSLSVLSLTSGSVRSVTTVPGFATVIPIP